MTELQSRKLTVVDVPDVQNIAARFVYNFFTPDERENGSGDPRVPGAFTDQKTQRLINNNTLRSEIPRYVEVSFDQSQLVSYGNLSEAKNESQTQLVSLEDFGIDLENVADEDSITNESYIALRENDPNGKFRIGKKIEALSSIAEISFEDTDQSKMLANRLGINREIIQDLISPYNSQKILKVNKAPEVGLSTIFDKSAGLRISSLLNKRVLKNMILGGDDVSPLSTLQTQQNAAVLTDAFNATASTEGLNQADIYPTLAPYKISDATSDQIIKILGAATVGYILIKKQITPSGRTNYVRHHLLLGKDSVSFLDDNVVYGSKYSYSVKAVYRIDAIVQDDTQETEFLKSISILVASRPSKVITVKTEEYEPPKPPDGLFYGFNYQKGRGLILTWQIPPGSSRDVKYFQIFKRKSIDEPFQCIAELDFDDSFLRTLRPEVVRQDLIRKYTGPMTYFEDKSFDRDSADTIYAICAIDAHGLSSGYSAQSQVGFDKIKNSLTLKNICKPGCPKAYPNFFIDPDMDDNIAVDSFTQDAIFDSGHSQVNVYFTPDARQIQIADSSIAKGFITENEGGKYKMHLLNLDFQKSTTVEIKIQDLQSQNVVTLL